MRLDRNLAPVENGFAPVGGGPARIQIVERAVTRLEPLLELRLGIGIERDVGILIVDLPAQHVGIVSETLGQLFGDFARKFAIFGIGEVELLPISVFGAVAFFVDPQRLGIFLRKPGRRGRGGSANHAVDAVFRGSSDGPIQPVEIVLTFAGLHAAPGKFAHAHHVDSGLLHQSEVGVPSRLWPLFRVPGGSHHDGRRGRRLCAEDTR